MTTTIAEFERSLHELDVDCTRVSPATFHEALEEAIIEPAIGARLPFEDVSLEETTVTLDPSSSELDAAFTGVTAARFGIADYGSLVLRSSSDGSEPVSLFPNRHIVILSADDVLPDMESAFDQMAETIGVNHESAILATGPSTTADMGALVTGAHGPKYVHVLILEGNHE